MTGELFVLGGGAVLSGTEVLEKELGAFPDVGQGADTAGSDSEGVGKDGVVKDNLGASCAQAFDGLEKRGTSLRLEGRRRLTFNGFRLILGNDRRDALEGYVCAVQDEG